MKNKVKFSIQNAKKLIFEAISIPVASFDSRPSNRIMFLGMAVLGIIFILALRYAYLTLFPSEMRAQLVSQDTKQHQSIAVVSTPRAAILDRNGRPLALTVLKPSIFVVPARIPQSAEIFRKLSKISGIPLERLENAKKKNRQFMWLKRQTDLVTLQNFEKIPNWEAFGGSLEEPARVYPNGSVAAQLIGFTGIDNQGLTGIERTFEETLRGEKQLVQVTRDARRKLAITFPNEASKPESTKTPLQLTLDLEIQRILEHELAKAVGISGAKGASGVVLDATNGDIVALASLPSFDLNFPETKTAESARLRPVQDGLELGSVIKPMVVAAALDKGVIEPDDVLNCENGVLKLPGATIHDVKKNGHLNIGGVLKFSSNVCMYKIARLLGRESMLKYFSRLGLTEPTGTGLAGEFQSMKQDPTSWREIRFANMAFGQGIAISPLQMARAFAAIIGGGVRHSLRIVQTTPETRSPGELVEPYGPKLAAIKPEVSLSVREMLTAIIEPEDATAPEARLAEFSAGGKTGTAQKFSPLTRSYSGRIPNFLGFFPAEHPRFVVYIVLDDVSVRPAWGGKLAAPVFAAVSTKLGRYLKSSGQLSLYSTKTGSEASTE